MAMITIQGISKISGYSPSTVSKALNNYSDISEKTRQKILKIAKDLRYVPNATAQSLVKKRSNTIGIVFEVEYGLNNLFFAKILESIRKQLEIQGYDLIFLSNNTNNGKDYLKHCYSKQVDGVFVISIGQSKEAVNKLLFSDIPVLSFDPDVEMKNSIYSESYNSIKTALKYLYDLGHRKIVFIQGSIYNFIGNMRYRSYLDFMKEYGLKPYYIKELDNAFYTFDEGYNAMRMNYERFGLPDAVLASSDLMAIGAMTFLKDKGYHIPDDVSIIGFDDIQLCEIIQPKLTTIRQDYEEIGKRASQTLIDMIENKITNIDPVIIPSKLIVRESCKQRK